jgi:hypothetical protein
MTTAADDDVPKLPRGRGLKFSGPEMFRIAITLALLVAVVMLAKPCGNAVSTFVMGFDGSAGSGSGHGSAKPPDPYEHLTPGMSDDEVKQAIERAKARNHALDGSGAGSALGSAATIAPAPILNGSAATIAPAPILNGSAATIAPAPILNGSATIAPPASGQRPASGSAAPAAGSPRPASGSAAPASGSAALPMRRNDSLGAMKPAPPAGSNAAAPRP